MNDYLNAWRHYADFSGRARRREYWMFVLFNFIASLILAILDYMLGFAKELGDTGWLSGLYSLAVLIPSIAVTARRLHDVGRSGWWQLIALIPLIGWIFVLVWTVTDSQPGSNGWGPNPKEGAWNYAR